MAASEDGLSDGPGPGPDGPAAVAALDGELDIADAADVAAALAAAAGRTGIVVDLARLTFINCSGVGALARARIQVLHAGGALLLAAPRSQVLQVIASPG